MAFSHLIYLRLFASMGLMQDNDLTIENESASRVYEVGYLLVPTLNEEELPTVYGDLKELVSSSNGLVISDEMPKLMDLAYSMSKVDKNIKSKYDTAYFGWTKFEISGDKVLDVKKALQNDPRFLRFLIIKTTRANTIIGKRFGQKDAKRKVSKTKQEDGEEVEINKEEIDKEIDAMIAA